MQVLSGKNPTPEVFPGLFSASSFCSCPSNFWRSCRNIRSISAHFPLYENEGAEVFIELLEPGRSNMAGRSPVAKRRSGNAPKRTSQIVFWKFGRTKWPKLTIYLLPFFELTTTNKLRQSGQSKRWWKCVLAHGPSQQEPVLTRHHHLWIQPPRSKIQPPRSIMLNTPNSPWRKLWKKSTTKLWGTDWHGPPPAPSGRIPLGLCSDWSCRSAAQRLNSRSCSWPQESQGDPKREDWLGCEGILPGCDPVTNDTITWKHG